MTQYQTQIARDVLGRREVDPDLVCEVYNIEDYAENDISCKTCIFSEAPYPWKDNPSEGFLPGKGLIEDKVMCAKVKESSLSLEPTQFSIAKFPMKHINQKCGEGKWVVAMQHKDGTIEFQVLGLIETIIATFDHDEKICWGSDPREIERNKEWEAKQKETI